MARPRLLDRMQTHPFWVFDASFVTPANLVLSVFDPVLAFSAVTAPEITTELRDIKPGNWQYTKKVVKRASVSAVTLSRGVSFYDSDFYKWITRAVLGVQPLRRNLVIVHFLGWKPLRQLAGGLGPEIGPTSLVERVPGRAWILYDCLPTRYKAGSDFDATSGSVSIQELEVQPEYVAELTIATLSEATAQAGSIALAVASAVL